MCVIIYYPQGVEMNRDDLSAAWNTNPDGAGYAVRNESGKVSFKRGFMNKNYFINSALKLDVNSERVLHLRISTGAGVTPQGTHPYAAADVLRMKGRTKCAICMNGVIYGQNLETIDGIKLNDTASYIDGHRYAFKAANQDITNIIQDATGAKWCIVKEDGVYLSGGFTESNGAYYSNLNHKYTLSWLTDYYSYKDADTAFYTKPETAAENMRLSDLLNTSLYLKVQKRQELWQDLEDYVFLVCNKYLCSSCKGCISDKKNINQLKRFIDKNYNLMCQEYWIEEGGET